jgi:hypothetical protein
MKRRAAVFAIAILTSAGLAQADDTGFASSHDLAKENGRLCMSNHAHTGSGEGATKAQARSGAVRSWIEFTNFEYGSDWASFAVAAGPATRYTKEASGWSATVDARPCKR